MINKLPPDKMIDYLKLLAFVIAALGGLFGVIVVTRWIRQFRPKSYAVKKTEKKVDPWEEAGRRKQIGDGDDDGLDDSTDSGNDENYRDN